MRKAGWRQLVVALLVGGLCCCVCVVAFGGAALAMQPLFRPPDGGLSQLAAEKIAAGDAYSTTPVRAILSRPARFSEVARGSHAVAPDTWVWAVTFGGTFTADTCGSEPTQSGQALKCPPPGIPVPQHSKLGLIDYFSAAQFWDSVPAAP